MFTVWLSTLRFFNLEKVFYRSESFEVLHIQWKIHVLHWICSNQTWNHTSPSILCWRSSKKEGFVASPQLWELHCCIKCPQILREKTSSQNSQGIALRIQWNFFSTKLDGVKKYFCRQYLQNFNALIFWFHYLQKVNAMPSDFWLKKKSFASLANNFWSFKKRIKKKFINGAKLVFFFSSEIWGHCIYFLQVLISEYVGIYILQVLPSNSILPSDLKD